MGVIKVEHITVDANATAYDYTLTNDVGSLNSAFVRISSVQKGSGGEPSTGNNEGPDSLSGALQMLDTSTVRAYQPTTQARRYMAEVWRYEGSSGGAHEFIVRYRGSHTFTGGGDVTIDLSGAGIVNKDKCIPFINGQLNSSTSVNDNGRTMSCAWLDASGDLVIRPGLAPSGGQVYVEVVECTGSAWSVYHSRQVTLANNASFDYYAESDFNTSGSPVSLSDVANSFIAQLQLSGDTTNSNYAIEDLGIRAVLGTPYATLSKDSTSASSGTIVLHILENSDVVVARATKSNSAIPAGNSTTYLTFPSITLTDLTESAMTLTGFSDGTGTAHGRGHMHARLTGLSEITSYQHRSGNNGDWSYEVYDLTGLTEAAGNDPIASSISGSSSITATLTARGQLQSTITGTSGLSSLLSGRASIGSSLEGLSSLSATLSAKLQGSASLTGSSALVGSLTAKATLQSTLTGNSSVTAGLSAKGTLQSSLSGDSSVTATLTSKLQGQASLSGSSALSGTLTAKAQGDSELIGSSSLVATLTAKGSLVSTLTGTSAISADLTEKSENNIVANISGSSSVSGTLTGKASLSSTLIGSSSVNATPQAIGSLLSNVLGSSGISATLTAKGALQSNLTGSSTITATLRGLGQGAIEASLTGSSTLTASLSAKSYIDTTVTGTSALVGTMFAYRALNLLIPLQTNLIITSRFTPNIIIISKYVQ